MIDLYGIFVDKIEKGVKHPHPHRWISTKYRSEFGWLINGNLLLGKLIIVDDQEIRSLTDHKRIFKKLGIAQRKMENCYYGCTKIANLYRSENGRSFSEESLIADRMQYFENGMILESNTPIGNIDCETGHEIIEIKQYKEWKHALGQILAYSTYRENKSKRIHLFGNVTKLAKTEIISKVCSDLDVSVTYDVS